MQQLSLREIDMVSGGELLMEISQPSMGGGGFLDTMGYLEMAWEFARGVVNGWNSFKK